jgi:hypothetical protein
MSLSYNTRDMRTNYFYCDYLFQDISKPYHPSPKPPPCWELNTMEKILIISGGNKGIGQGILEAYKRNGYRVISIARTCPLTDGNTEEKHIQFDLGHSELVAPTLSRIFIR